MAKVPQVEIYDDYDQGLIGPELAQVVELEVKFPGTRRARYVLDLRPESVEMLQSWLEDFLEEASPVTVKGQPVTGKVTATAGAGSAQTSAIRDWARANGYELSDRGRIPAHFVEAFDESH